MRNAPISLTIVPAKPTGPAFGRPDDRLCASRTHTTDLNLEKGWSTSLA